MDWWAPREAEALPPEAIEELVTLLRASERKCTFPLQVLCNIIALISKPKGGDRPIGLACFLYCVWSIIRAPPTVQWDERKAGFWDDAVRGSSALQATLLRRAKAEAAILGGKHCGELCWDMEKFYDSVPLVDLI